MLIFLHPRVLSRVSGFPVASPCLWGKLQNLSFSKVSKQVVMSFCVAGVALCDIPSCLITCRKWLWFSRHARRVYGGSCKTSPFRRFPSRLSCRFAWQAWHFLTFQLYTLHFFFLRSTLYTLHSSLHTLYFTLHSPLSTLYTLHSTLYTLHSKLYILNSTLYTLHSSLHTLHFTLHTPHSTLYPPHSTLYSLHFTIRVCTTYKG